ncbi:hypothetical protein AGMMS49928_16280 [Spirochaetia bacterium]|nr:hypothetical protein AGMMS49928_16280 [Spirochaetia bacterium]
MHILVTKRLFYIPPLPRAILIVLVTLILSSCDMLDFSPVNYVLDHAADVTVSGAENRQNSLVRASGLVDIAPGASVIALKLNNSRNIPIKLSLDAPVLITGGGTIDCDMRQNGAKEVIVTINGAVLNDELSLTLHIGADGRDFAPYTFTIRCPEYTVTFDNQGLGQTIASQVVPLFGAVSYPGVLTHTGKNHLGWYKESDGTTPWDFASDTVTADTVIYAQWDAALYTVIFDNQGHGTAPAPTNVYHDGLVPNPGNLAETGYSFGGWFKESACTTPWDFASDTVTANTIIYAGWNIVSYTVTFDNQGHGTTPGPQTINHGSLVTNPGNLTGTGWTFSGWYKEAACTTPWNFASDTITANTIIYAGWNIVSYTVTFDNQGHGTAPAPQTVNHGGLVTNPGNLTGTGYAFGGWYKEAACTNPWDFASDTITANTIIYAGWDIISYTVTFDNQGHGASSFLQTVAYGGLVTEPTPVLTETGWTFGGWYKEPACTNPWNFGSDTISAATTIYAKWTINTYTVTFNNQGHGAAKTPQTVNHGGLVTNPGSLSETGYIFSGWFKEPGCINPWNFSSDTITSATIIYAGWDLTGYTVTFDKRGHGTTTPGVQTVNHGDHVSDPGNLTQTGYTFGGWYKEAACTTPWNFGSDTVTAVTIIYAKWTVISYTITYHLDSGTNNAANPANYTIESAATLLAPTKTDYEFDGWYTDAGFTTAAAVPAIPLGSYGDKDFYARWKTRGDIGITQPPGNSGRNISASGSTTINWSSGTVTFSISGDTTVLSGISWQVNGRTVTANTLTVKPRTDGYGLQTGSYAITVYFTLDGVRYSEQTILMVNAN